MTISLCFIGCTCLIGALTAAGHDRSGLFSSPSRDVRCEVADGAYADTMLKAGAYQGASRAYRQLLLDMPTDKSTSGKRWHYRLCYASATILSHQGLSAQEERDADRALAPFFLPANAVAPPAAQVAVAWRLRIYYLIQHRFVKEAAVEIEKARAYTRTSALSKTMRPREALLLDLLSAQNDFLCWRLSPNRTNLERARQGLERIFCNEECVRLYLTTFDHEGMDEDAQRKLLQTGAVSPLGRLAYLNAFLAKQAYTNLEMQIAANVAALSAASAALALRQIGLGIYYRPTGSLSPDRRPNVQIPLAVSLHAPKRIASFRKNVLTPVCRLLREENGTLVLFAVPDDLAVVAFSVSGNSSNTPAKSDAAKASFRKSSSDDPIRVKFVVDQQLNPLSLSSFTDIHAMASEWQASAMMETPPPSEPEQAAELGRRLLRSLIPSHTERLVIAAPSPLDGLAWPAIGVPERQWNNKNHVIRIVDRFSVRVAPNGLVDLATPISSPSPRKSSPLYRVLALASPSLHFAADQNNQAGSLGTLTEGSHSPKKDVLREFSRSDIVDLALHGSYTPSGEAGFLLLNNELVTASDLRELPFHSSHLLVAATCATTGSQIDVDFLATSAHRAGFASVLSSLFVLNDAATQRMVGRFYEQIRAGDRKDDALKKAMLAERSKPLYEWAGLRMSGDPCPLFPISALGGRNTSSLASIQR